MLDIERVRRNLLDEAGEDFVGLYEIVWDLESPVSPTSRNASVAAARKIVEEMISTHDGRLFRTSRWPPEAWEAVPSEATAEILADPRNWQIDEKRHNQDLFWLALGV